MKNRFQRAGWTGWAWTAAVALALTGAGARPADAQQMMQLIVPNKGEYTLGRFRYTPPSSDGWRQIANNVQTLSLLYALQKEEDKIDTIFGVAIEVHEIPDSVQVESAAALADLSRKQFAEQRKDDLVALSGIEPVPGVENLYTYRLLVKTPVEGRPPQYEVYYVMTAPDRSQYLVIQCITKEQDYDKQIYFNELYGSLASLRYVPEEGAAGAGAAPSKDAAAPATKPADKPADKPAPTAD